MDLQHINMKMFVDGELKIDPSQFINVFHRWIKDKELDGLLIDVADYRHVPAGPGVMLIGFEADYSMDHADNRWGLRYNRKAIMNGSDDERLHHALCAAANACHMLEAQLADEGPLTFDRNTFEVSLNDRALAPNTAETFEAFQPTLESFLSTVLGHNDIEVKPPTDRRGIFRVTVELGQPMAIESIVQTLPS